MFGIAADPYARCFQASMLGLVASSPNTPAVAYTASKHAVLGLTKTDAAMYAPRGIRINAICPGYVATPLLKAASVSGTVVQFDVC
jgi:NAD(P)-dependent dehydrogenase (short-subunit alcohol dehydrogenase family)